MFGCSFKGPREDEKQHEKKCKFQHLKGKENPFLRFFYLTLFLLRLRVFKNYNFYMLIFYLLVAVQVALLSDRFYKKVAKLQF